MAEIACRFCGSSVSVADNRTDVRLRAECGTCGSLFWATAPQPSGYETIRHLPSAEQQKAAAAPDSTRRPPTGTVFLMPEQDGERQRPLRTLRRANLVVEGERTSTLPITGTRTEVGRKGSHLVIADPALSASHFVIETHGKSYVIRDLGSSNGTCLNGHRIESSRLESGDTIHAGETRFSFRIEEVIPLDASR